MTHRTLSHVTILMMIGLAGVPAASDSLAQEVDSLRWTPELVMDHRELSDVDLSPNGELVAYVVRAAVMDSAKSEYLSHVWIAATDGTWNEQYTQGEKSCSNPRFSPDGRHLAFTTSRSGENQVWVMRVQGGEAEQITNAEAGVSSYRWSPDGARIAYTMVDPKTKEEKAAATAKTDVIVVGENLKYAHLYVTDFNEGEDKQRATQRLTAGDFHISQFDWSPDGTTIAFSHQADPRINVGFLNTDISLVASDSGAVRPLVTWPGVDASPLFSPDGEWIAFESDGGSVEPIGLDDVHVVSVNGGTPRPLASTANRSADVIGWAADGGSVFTVDFDGTNRRVYEIPLSGTQVRTIAPVEGVVGSVGFDRGRGRMVLVYEDSDSPEELFVTSVADFDLQRLTAHNVERALPRMARTELVHWTSPDGTAVEGLLTYPADYRSGRRYPLILSIHGGPAGIYARSFTGAPGIYPTQIFAQEGYAVLRPNPRGSTGYGKEFRYANVMDWGFGDFEDVMAGVDEVIAMGVAHPDSLALMGWSYGGYMTSFMVTKTDRFKAASMGAGLSNLLSMVHTTDISDYLVAHMGGELWDNLDTYEKHSAIYRIDRVTTPTQVIHGANDERVPFSQGQEFYEALKRRGVPTEMVVYPRTPHGPQEPKLLMDVSQRILTWFDRHLR